MRNNWLKILGVISLVEGIIFIFLTNFKITGNVIAESIGVNSGFVLGLILVIGGVLMFIVEDNKILYHGTCRAFVEVAKERGGMLGPDYDEVSFTPDYEHAKAFAESWKTPAGRKRLKQYFGKLPDEYFEPIILEFDGSKLGPLEKRMDANAIEFFKKGPVKLPNHLK